MLIAHTLEYVNCFGMREALFIVVFWCRYSDADQDFCLTWFGTTTYHYIKIAREYQIYILWHGINRNVTYMLK